MISLCHGIIDRVRWELREWLTPSCAAFLQAELDHALLGQINWLADERVLDVGCAHGAYMSALSRRGARMTGIDVSTDALRRARNASGRVVAASGLRLPFKDGAFDTVLCHKTMHLFEHPDEVIREFSRVIRPGGRIVFSSSNNRSPYAISQSVAIRVFGNPNWAFANRLSAEDWILRFTAGRLSPTRVFSCNLVWPIVFRVCDRWVVPNEWMRRYSRWIRRLTRTPLETGSPLWRAQDYVVEMTKPAA